MTANQLSRLLTVLDEHNALGASFIAASYFVAPIDDEKPSFTVYVEAFDRLVPVSGLKLVRDENNPDDVIGVQLIY